MKYLRKLKNAVETLEQLTGNEGVRCRNTRYGVIHIACTLYQFTQVYNTFYIKTKCCGINISDVFKFDPDYEAKEEKYNCLRKEIQVQNVNQHQEKKMTQEKKVEMVSKKLSVSV